jgi:tyrosyl-tRNA synthetase
MKIITDEQKIEEILTYGVEEIFERDHLKKALLSGKQLRIKNGIDPTGPNIHLGRASQFWKLRAFQELGHQIVLIIGDFTAQIGDASDKDAMRKTLTEKEVKENMKNYLKQIGKILDLKKVEVHYNSKWFKKMTVLDFVRLQTIFTAQQTIQRRNFKERWDGGKPIGLHELDYPIFQGYDSVMVKADIETGGFDQLFNLQAGREIQRHFNQKPQDIITLKMLNGLDGRKMSTSWGNIITIVDEPNDMYGKVMSMRDEFMDEYVELCVPGKLKPIWLSLIKPKEKKQWLAKEIVTLYHGKKAAEEAEAEFNSVFGKHELPSDIETFEADKNIYPVLDLLCDSGLAASKNEAKRLIEQGAIVVIVGENETKVSDWKKELEIEDGMIVRRGARQFKKMILK